MWGRISLSRAPRPLCLQQHASAVAQLALPAQSQEELTHSGVSLSLSLRQHQHRLSRHCHLHSETCQRSLEANLVGVDFSQRITRSISSGITRSGVGSWAQVTGLSRHSRCVVFQLSQILEDSEKFPSGVSAQTETLKARTKPCSTSTPLL